MSVPLRGSQHIIHEHNYVGTCLFLEFQSYLQHHVRKLVNTNLSIELVVTTRRSAGVACARWGSAALPSLRYDAFTTPPLLKVLSSTLLAVNARSSHQNLLVFSVNKMATTLIE